MNKPKTGEFCWNELATANVQAAKDFYGKLLGWKFTEENVGNMTYTIITNGENACGGIWQIPTEQKDQIPPHWMGYILVDDIEQTLEQAKSFGATVKVPVTQAGEIGSFIVIVDPTGAHIAFWEAKKKC